MSQETTPRRIGRVGPPGGAQRARNAPREDPEQSQFRSDWHAEQQHANQQQRHREHPPVRTDRRVAPDRPRLPEGFQPRGDVRPADPRKSPFRPGEAAEPQRLHSEHEQQIHQAPQREALEPARPRRNARGSIRRRRVHAGKQTRDVARRGRPQNGTGNEKVRNLSQSKRNGDPVQQNQARIKAPIIQQPKSNNGRVNQHRDRF